MRKAHQLLEIWKSKWTQVYLGFLCIALIFFIELIHLPLLSFAMLQLDNRIYDQIVQLNFRPHQQNPRVVIIDIDNESVQKEGRWPWPRNKMAALVNQLKQSGVVTIATDIVMSEPEVNYALGLKAELQPLLPKLTPSQKKLPSLLDEIAPQVDNDQIFANSLLDHNVVLGFLFHNDQIIKKGVLPTPLRYPYGNIITRGSLALSQFLGYNGCLELFLKASTQAGVVTNLPDWDGSVRHGLTLASFDNKLYPSLALATAMNYLMVDSATLDIQNNQLHGIRIGPVFVPTNEYGQTLIPFWGPPGTLSYYSATDIIQGKVNPKELQGTVAVIGSTMILLADLHQAPVAQTFPGVEMVGNMVEGIVSQQLVSQYDWQTLTGRFYFLLIGLFFALVFSFFGVARMLLLALVSILVILTIVAYLFASKNLYVPCAMVLVLIIFQTLSNSVYLFLMEKRQKRKINQLFGQYVPQEYVKELVELPEQYSMEGQVRNMTVQFSDIRNFTGISESLDASEVKRLLNTFFTPITEIIFSCRGTVDKYVGDMIVAFWGAPIQDEEHAYHAIMSSLLIIKQLPEINKKMMELNLPEVSLGIGLASGLMNVGDMGSEFRRTYTVLGDTVNLGSRLQDLTKFYGVNILTNDVARNGQDKFVWRVIDKITVKGRRTGLTIYQPLGMVTEVSKEVLLELEEYHKALDDYYGCNWSSAEKKFDMLKDKSPDIYLYKMYLERIKEFLLMAPPDNWSGIYVHQHK